jgi:hypothetical protein
MASFGGDPLALGLVDSLANPAGTLIVEAAQPAAGSAARIS